VLLTYEHGADGILISNHSGRPLDTTRASLDVLFEIRKQIPLLIRPVFRGPAGITKDLLEHPEPITSTNPRGEKEGAN
jgi:L-lactate dehydrogenase (cytochrome)